MAIVRISRSVILACGSLRWWSMWSKLSRMQKVAMILSSVVDLRVRGGIVPAHTGRLDKVASWVIIPALCLQQANALGARLIGMRP
jgi:hypothetical protein